MERKKVALRPRGISKPEEHRGPMHSARGGGLVIGHGPAAVVPHRPSSPPAGQEEELKDLVEAYRGFGMFCLIRVLMFRGSRGRLLAFLSALLLFGQWAGPLGFIAFKVRNAEYDNCESDAGPWARFVIASVAFIYTARLSVASLSHTLKVPEGFNSFNMPKWWKPYRYLDLVLASLFYDTTIFMFNLFIVFQDKSVEDMIVNILALEFFTIIDDEFKCALLKYDSSFLDDMVVARAAGPGNVHPSASGLEGGGGGGGAVPTGEHEKGDSSSSTCVDALACVAWTPLIVVLWFVRLACLVAGPFFGCFMIGYGPYCLGASAE